MKVFQSRRFQEIAGGLFLLAILIMPVWAFAGSKQEIYVNASASGKQDGSAKNPYKTIGEALNHADSGDKVFVSAGTYKENIYIPKGVKVYGADEDKVIINAKKDSEPAVTMKHKTVLDKFTVKGGRHGIVVTGDSAASISKCIIKDNDRDGIHVYGSSPSDQRLLSVTKTEIKNNGRAGIFAERHKVSFIENEIHDNGRDGIALAADSKGWLDDNTIRDNKSSGMSITLDGTSVYMGSHNVFRDNKREGVEIESFGRTGIVNIKKSRFINNKNFGVTKIQKAAAPASVWKGVTLDQNIFTGNDRGEVSPITLVK